MAHVGQLACSLCGIDIKRFWKHNFLVLGQLVIIGPDALKKNLWVEIKLACLLCFCYWRGRRNFLFRVLRGLRLAITGGFKFPSWGDTPQLWNKGGPEWLEVISDPTLRWRGGSCVVCTAALLSIVCDGQWRDSKTPLASLCLLVSLLGFGFFFFFALISVNTIYQVKEVLFYP